MQVSSDGQHTSHTPPSSGPANLSLQPPGVLAVEGRAALPVTLPAEVAGIAVPDEVFDRYAHLVRATLGVPVGLVSLVTTNGQVFPGAEGLPSPWQQTRCTGLSHSFCQYVVARDAPLVITDAREDPELADNLAITDIGVIAYAGFPLHAADGTTVGSLCAIDTSPRAWSEHELDVLAHLAATASSELALRAAAQDAQQASRAAVLWDLTTRAAGIGTYVMHLPGNDLEVDDRLLELSALTRETFSGRPEDVYAHVHPEDLPAVVASVEHAVASAGTYAAEYRIVLSKDQHRWISAHGQVLTDSDGTAVALVGAVHDVTEARAATARITDITESMAVGYLSMDADWRITHVNAEGRRVLGAAGHDLTGQVLWELFPATVGTQYETNYRRAVDSGQVVAFDAYYPAPLNAWFEIRATPEGEGLALYFLDITDRYSAEQAHQAASARIAGIGRVALSLTDADSIEDLAVVMAEQGHAALGADGGAIAVVDPDDAGVLVSYISTGLGEQTRAEYSRMPMSTPLPVTQAARSGATVLIGDQAAAVAYSPVMEQVNATTGCQAWASLPLVAGGQVLGVLSVGWRESQSFEVDQVELLETYAAQCAQALQRLSARDGERLAREQAQSAANTARTSAQRQGALVAIARALTAAEDEREVLEVLGKQGAALLEADGTGLALLEPDGRHVRTLASDTFDADLRAGFQRVPVGFPMPIIHAAATGAVHLFGDRASTVAAFPGAEVLYTAAGVQASACLPLRGRDGLLGSISVAFTGVRTWTPEEEELLEAFAAMTTQALERITAHDAEQAALAAASGIAETLQRSMLTAPPEPDHLQIAVRYAASATHAEVGGDWYDAFITSDGLTSLVIGDVTGHDMRAASVMGQLRNLVRGIGFTLGEPPARVLGAVDRAAAGLGIDTVATAIVAQIEVDDAHRAAGTRLLRWSNAGHLPPLLIGADGTTGFLEGESDLVLGWDPSIDRHDHEHVLAPGSTVLLFTDGLVERRGVHLERGLAWLAQAAGELASSPESTVEELCDGLIALVGDHLDDDVALLALRAHPEDAPRPVEAGPVRVPARLDEALSAAAEADS